jgi:hypothetical protein
MPKTISATPQGGTGIEPVHKALDQVLKQIAKRDQKITWVNAQRAAEAVQAAAEKEALEAVLRSTQDQLRFTQEQLRTREAQLEEILNSRTWKIAVFLQRLRTFLIPLQSRREAILRQVFRIARSLLGKTRKS